MSPSIITFSPFSSTPPILSAASLVLLSRHLFCPIPLSFSPFILAYYTLLHPDNILGHSVLLASVMIEDKAQAWDWFMTRVIPAALPYYEPILFQEPAIGSGVMMLAAAACYPAWAVQLNLVRFFGQDLDPVCVRMAKINGLLYGLNGFALRLAEAAATVTQVRQQTEQPERLAIPGSTLEVVKAVLPTPEVVLPELSFESLFRTATGQKVPAEIAA